LKALEHLNTNESITVSDYRNLFGIIEATATRDLSDLVKKATTKKGLKVNCALDTGQYPTGRKVTDEEFSAINLSRNEFRGEWNYTIFQMTVAEIFKNNETNLKLHLLNTACLPDFLENKHISMS